jgi:hypothetical protein
VTGRRLLTDGWQFAGSWGLGAGGWGYQKESLNREEENWGQEERASALAGALFVEEARYLIVS